MVLASFTDTEIQQNEAEPQTLFFPGLEIHLKEQTVYKERPRGRRHGGIGRWRISFPTGNTKAMPSCRSAARWTSFPRSARPTKGEVPVDFNERLFHRLVDYAADAQPCHAQRPIPGPVDRL